MKIKQFSLRHYGPLPDTGSITLHNFNLFWGKNEDGKTLTIDALTKILVGRNIREFERIDRVKENPDGYVIIEDDKGKEIKLPEKKDLTKVVGLTPSECRNIFVIRNSDLSIARESEFYTNVMDRLTGLRTGEISKIKERLHEMGKITPMGVFRDIKGEKIRTIVKDAKELTKKIEDLDKEIKEKGVDELEEESVVLKEKIEGIEREIKELEDARKRGKYDKGKDALDNLKKYLEEFKGLEIYNEEDKQLWRDCEKDIERCNGGRKNKVAELQKTEGEFKEISEKLGKMKGECEVLDARKKRFDDEIRSELRGYSKERERLAQQKGKDKFFTLLGIISAIFLAIALFGAIFNPSPFFYILSTVFLVSTGVSCVFKLQFLRGKAQLAAAFERIRMDLSKFGLDAENIERINEHIQGFDEEYQKRKEELQKIKSDKENLDKMIKQLRDKVIPEIQSEINRAKENINHLKIKSRETYLQEYTGRLERKQELEGLIKEQKGILETHFGSKAKDLEGNIAYWEEEVRNLEEYEEKAKNIEYNEKAMIQLKEEGGQSKKKLEEIRKNMADFQKKMEEIERKANEILRSQGEYLYCSTSMDLKAIKNRLQGFVDENESTKDNVLEVIEIFEEIEAEEKGKVSELFGKESPVSNYFNEITDGLYKEVTLDQEMGKIKVKRKDGAILEAEKLSGGTYDQLYFSIRLALGEKLLKGKKGFFIMDDPFIKADPSRLKRQIDTLKKISESGWQVMYFSAKGEIKETLKAEMSRGIINCVELPGIFY
jgi:uncharacterized protein YhaN